MCVITYTSSLTEAVIDAITTLFVWIIMLICHLIGLHYGEIWNVHSFGELAGFVMLVAGNLTYDGQLKLLCFRYSDYNELVDESQACELYTKFRLKSYKEYNIHGFLNIEIHLLFNNIYVLIKQIFQKLMFLYILIFLFL